jgi:ArsR family transcriptional regulator, arsenate/arsenite/antimonite-responsive transcriptional repressor
MADTKHRLSEHEIQLIAKALGDPRRYEILKQLGDCGCTHSLPCEALRECTAISPATLSHHMKELETANLIKVTREGRSASYTLQRDVLEAFFDSIRHDLT